MKTKFPKLKFETYYNQSGFYVTKHGFFSPIIARVLRANTGLYNSDVNLLIDLSDPDCLTKIEGHLRKYYDT